MSDGWTRADHLGRLGVDPTTDVLVVGGGVTGAGAALDLGARGLHVTLVDQADFAQGTSSRSTKLFHGGIRYLPHLRFGLVSEGLREQKVLARIADFLYRPLEFVIPIYRQYGIADAPEWAARGWRAPLALRAGLMAYDLLGGFGRPGSRHRRMRPDEILDAMPLLRRDGLTGGLAYSDAQTDDARLVLSLAKTAVRRFDATAVNRVRVDRLERIGAGFRAHLIDVASGHRLTVGARSVLAATGAFDPPDLDVPGPRLRMTRSKGTHLIVDRRAIPIGDRALVLPETDDGRVLYIIPWLGHAMIGTTDTRFTADPAHPTASTDDVDYLLRHVRRYLDVDVVEPMSTFAGLRALADTGGGRTAKASREHVVAEPIPGYVQVAGGKLTTYRRIAAEAADRVARFLGIDRTSETRELPLVGTGATPEALAGRLAAAGIPESAVGPTIDRYGTEAAEIARLAGDRPLLATAFGDGRSTHADVVYAVRQEGAARISDVTLRRTHLAWFTPDHARADAAALASLMADELGWTDDDRARALADHEAELSAEGL